ncbi:MAG: endolytic transglycosylase MltG [Ilumatobacteraceae bacterium]
MTHPTGDPLLPGGDWQVDPWDDPSEAAAASFDDPGPSLSRWRGPVRAVVAALVAAVLLIGVAGWWVVHELNPGGQTGAAVTFTVNPGDDLDAVINRLSDGGFIGNPTVFRWYLRSRGGLELIPGYYALRPGSNAGDIIERLATPPAETFLNVTFPEGMTLAQMGTRLAEKVVSLDAQRFVDAATDGSVTSTLAPDGVSSLEGLLFPDTYQVSGDDTESRVVARLAETMQRVARQVDLVSGAKALGLTPYEVLVVASMIEREAKVGDDRAKIARVIYNRLAAGMTLDIDATLKYIDDGTLSWTELKQADSPFNSYRSKKLPPTPIANPGRASIVAALSPAGPPSAGDEACDGLSSGTKCDYFYYVLWDTDGRHRFASTLDQHEANVDVARAAGVLP